MATSRGFDAEKSRAGGSSSHQHPSPNPSTPVRLDEASQIATPRNASVHNESGSEFSAFKNSSLQGFFSSKKKHTLPTKGGAERQPQDNSRPLIQNTVAIGSHALSSSQVCLICKNLKIGIPVYFDVAIADLDDSAKTCPSCKLLHQAAGSIMDRFPEARAARKLHIAPAGSWVGLKVCLDDFHRSGKIVDAAADWYEVYVLRVDPSISRRLRVLPQISGNTSSEQALKWSLLAYGTCLSDHNCTGDDFGPLPTRVLDVARMGDTQDVKLYVTRNESERYFCLSHCWGGKQPLQTTKANLPHHQSRIRWSQLPKTFQEAITFTRKFGVRYLWIDSLCIIQDDREDWRTESSKMCSVYQNSDLTLSATASPNAHGGCFARPTEEWRGWGVSYLSTEFRVRRLVDHRGLYQDGSGRGFHSGGACPLVSRAWVFQERLLAPRVLHFGRQELIFECNMERTCECATIENDNSWHKDTYNEIFAGQKPAEKNWKLLLMSYTRLQLTYHSDRLAALSGIVERLQKHGMGRYFAGLWKDTIVTDLLWYVPRSTARSMPEKRHAPSWSWAADESEIYPLINDNGDGQVHALCDVRHIQCPVEGPVISDELDRSWIDISGAIAPVKIRRLYGIYTDRYVLAVEEHLPSNEQAKLYIDHYIHQGPGRIDPSKQLYCLKIALSNTRRFSLILNDHGIREQDTGQPVRIYERIGLLEESFGKDNADECVEAAFSLILDALPQTIGPDLSNIENDRQQLKRPTSSAAPRRQRRTEQALDTLAWSWSTVRIV